MADLASVYKTRNGRVLIEIDLSTTDQIFNSLDPAPFHEKEIDRDAEQYIVDIIRDFPAKTEFTIVIHAPLDCMETGKCPLIPNAIRNHFRYKTLATERQFRQRARYGRINLLVALAFLAITHVLSKAILHQFGDNLLFSFVAEALTIAGWVALWAPITLLLYELYPIIQARNVYDKVSTMEIQMVPKNGSEPVERL